MITAATEGKTPMSATFSHVPARTRQPYWVFGDLFTFLITGEESGGNYSTMEIVVSPGGGPPPHIHHLADEQFYVLEGNLTFTINGHVVLATTSDFIHIPRGVVHAFRNGSSPSRLLATFAPAGVEQFFLAIGDPVLDPTTPAPPLTAERIAHAMAIESRYDHETVQPSSSNGATERASE